jgi:prepilin-type N-terminal cleavage/methylation domain-containing protein
MKDRAFTLIEAMVAMAIIAILVAIVIPAIQAAREAARSAQCIANLRQIGIAMHAYCGMHNMFPPDQLLTYSNVSQNRTSPHVFLLQYMEQQNLYNSINTDFVRTESPASPTLENRTARHTRLGMFLCPSDGGSNHLNSYRFNRGRFGIRPATTSYDGPFSIGVLPTPACITDGLTQTAFVSERIAGSFTAGLDQIPSGLKSPSQDYVVSSDAQFIPLCLGDSPGDWSNTSGRY